MNEVTWWSSGSRSELQLWGGAVGQVGHFVRRVQAEADGRLRLLLDSDRYEGGAGGGRGCTLSRRTWTGGSRGKPDGRGDVRLCLH